MLTLINIKQTGAMEGMLLCEENSGSSRDPLVITPSPHFNGLDVIASHSI